MAKAIDEIKAELMELPRGEREDLAEFLIESLERDEVRSAWAREARRRYDEIRAGRRRTIGNDEAFARLRARFG
jgi:putative addiction module component (TIGR02574 family)